MPYVIATNSKSFMPLQGIVFLCGGLETNVVKQQQKDAHGALVYCGDPGRHWLLFTAANEIYYVIRFDFNFVRRNFVCGNLLNFNRQPKWEEKGGRRHRRHRRHRMKANSNRIPSPRAPQYLFGTFPCDRLNFLRLLFVTSLGWSV